MWATEGQVVESFAHSNANAAMSTGTAAAAAAVDEGLSAKKA